MARRGLAELSEAIRVSSVAHVRDVLNAGYSAIVEATFLEATWRRAALPAPALKSLPYSSRERRRAVGLNTEVEIETFSREPW